MYISRSMYSWSRWSGSKVGNENRNDSHFYMATSPWNTVHMLANVGWVGIVMLVGYLFLGVFSMGPFAQERVS